MRASASRPARRVLRYARMRQRQLQGRPPRTTSRRPASTKTRLPLLRDALCRAVLAPCWAHRAPCRALAALPRRRERRSAACRWDPLSALPTLRHGAHRGRRARCCRGSEWRRMRRLLRRRWPRERRACRRLRRPVALGAPARGFGALLSEWRAISLNACSHTGGGALPWRPWRRVPSAYPMTSRVRPRPARRWGRKFSRSPRKWKLALGSATERHATRLSAISNRAWAQRIHTACALTTIEHRALGSAHLLPWALMTAPMRTSSRCARSRASMWRA